jgi:hypothetical protein
MKGCDEVIDEASREGERDGFFFNKKVIGKLQCYPIHWVAL